MILCSICGKRVSVAICRRCGLSVCKECYFHHGLCRSCAISIGRLRPKTGVFKKDKLNEF